MKPQISSDLFNRLEDNNWQTICHICCGQKPWTDFPEEHKHVLDLIVDLNDKQLYKYLNNYFSLAIECYKNREEESVLNVFVFIASVLDLDIKFNDKPIVDLLPNRPKASLKTKVLVFNHVFESLSQSFRHLSLNQSFDFNSLIETLLDNNDNDLSEELFVTCFHLIIQIDYQLIERHLKQIIIRCNLDNEDTDEVISAKNKFFITLFEVFFKTKKSIKFHEILSEISIDLNPRLLTLDSHLIHFYGKSILELPFGQSFDLWKLFLDKFDVNNRFWTQLLTNYLHHIRCLNDLIPNQFILQTNRLLDQTKDLLKNTANNLESNDEELVQNVLELYYAFESLIILQMTYNQNHSSQDNWSHILAPNDWFDLSVIYDFTDKSHWISFFEDISRLSPIIKQVLVKNLLQKFQFWKSFELNVNLSEDQKKLMKTSIEELLSAIVVNFGSTNLNSFTLQQIIVISRHLNRNDLCLLTDSLINTIEDNTVENTFDVKHLLMDGSVWENIDFQTAFVSSFWRRIAMNLKNKKRKLNEDNEKVDTILDSLVSNSSVWFKYSNNSPNIQKLDKMWSIVANVSSEVEQLIQRQPIIRNVKIPIHLMELFVHLVPLEYLLPSNQMRCLLSLSILLFTIDFSEDNNISLLDLILDSILSVFDGVRSVWFFNFFNPSLYLTQMLKVFNNYKNHEKLKLLFTKLFESFARNLVQIEELKNKLTENEDNNSFELLVMIETIVLKRCLHVLNMKTVPKNMVKMKEVFGPLSHELSTTIHNRIKKQLMSATNVESLDSMLIIDSFAIVFEFQVSKSTSDEEAIHFKTKWRKLLTKLIDISLNQLKNRSTNESCIKFLVLLCVNQKKLENILPKNFTINLWHVLCPQTQDVIKPEDTLQEDVGLAELWKQREDFKEFFDEIKSTEDQNIKRFLASISTQNTFTELIKPLIIALFKCISVENFDHLMKSLITQLKTNDYLSVSHSLSLWISVFESDFHLNEEKSLVFHRYINDLMTLCANHCRRCRSTDGKHSREFQLYVKVLVLKTFRSVIHITRNVMTSSQIFMAFHTCIDIRINDYISQPNVFTALFDNIYGILNEVLLQHKYIAISAMSSFHLIVDNLIHSLMNVSNEQQFIGYEPIVRHELEICSKNIDRLLTLMSTLGTDYSTFAPHLIASYVTQTQKVSVHIVVKNNIISGINRLLRLLSETNAMEMIYSRMNESSRNVLKIIIENYDKYYKFKGQI